MAECVIGLAELVTVCQQARRMAQAPVQGQGIGNGHAKPPTWPQQGVQVAQQPNRVFHMLQHKAGLDEVKTLCVLVAFEPGLHQAQTLRQGRLSGREGLQQAGRGIDQDIAGNLPLAQRPQQGLPDFLVAHTQAQDRLPRRQHRAQALAIGRMHQAVFLVVRKARGEGASVLVQGAHRCKSRMMKVGLACTWV